MSVTRTFRGTSYASDHFEPESALDPQAQRRMRGALEQIDYAAFAANREVIGQALGRLDAGSFRRVARATAAARARWAAEALAVSAAAQPTPDQIQRLGQLHTAYLELRDAYEGMRRMVERGYLAYIPADD